MNEVATNKTEISLIPGEFYRIRDYAGACPLFDHTALTPYTSMYVREEELKYCQGGSGNWNVFAGIWNNGMLMRIRAKKGNISLDNPELIEKNEGIQGQYHVIMREKQKIIPSERDLVTNDLVTKLVISSKNDRIRTLNITSFIEDAYNLINNPELTTQRGNQFPEFQSRLRELLIKHYQE